MGSKARKAATGWGSVKSPYTIRNLGAYSDDGSSTRFDYYKWMLAVLTILLAYY